MPHQIVLVRRQLNRKGGRGQNAFGIAGGTRGQAGQHIGSLQQPDQQSINVTLDGSDSEINADGDDMYWLTGARYHF